MAIFTQMGEQVEIISGLRLDLLDPSTQLPLYAYVDVRSVADPTWVRKFRVCQLKADRGFEEIQEVLNAREQRP